MKRRKRKRGKTTTQVIASTPPKQIATTETLKPKKLTSVTPAEAHQDDEHKSASVSSLSSLIGECTWMQVSRKRKRPQLPLET